VEQTEPKYNILELAKKWQEGAINKEEKEYYEQWYNSFNDAELELNHQSKESEEELSKRIFTSLKEQINHSTSANVVKKRFYYRILAAASILFCLAVGGLWLFKKYSAQQNGALVQDIMPGANKAFLTLANGKRIALNDEANGRIFNQQGVQIVKTKEGEVIYQSTGNPTAEISLVYNSIETPKGGQYQIHLPDGTKVWLNAASSLKFPATFTNTAQRKVELIGEAYFEVAKDKHHPFLVSTGTQTVEVLGTHFNINSYSDEPAVKTTLFEGSVKISSHSTTAAYSSTIIKPGEEALTTNKTIEVKQADLEAELAWKNGLFIFKDSNLKTVMRQLSRWYDIDVEFKGTVPPGDFNGKVYRNMTLQNVLEVLSFSQVKFKIEGRKLTIFP
jgi:transmembrane sensor